MMKKQLEQLRRKLKVEGKRYQQRHRSRFIDSSKLPIGWETLKTCVLPLLTLMYFILQKLGRQWRRKNGIAFAAFALVDVTQIIKMTTFAYFWVNYWRPTSQAFLGRWGGGSNSEIELTFWATFVSSIFYISTLTRSFKSWLVVSIFKSSKVVWCKYFSL